jgi:hypothetical protein
MRAVRSSSDSRHWASIAAVADWRVTGSPLASSSTGRIISSNRGIAIKASVSLTAEVGKRVTIQPVAHAGYPPRNARTIRFRPYAQPWQIGQKQDRRKLLRRWLTSLDNFRNWLIRSAARDAISLASILDGTGPPPRLLRHQRISEFRHDTTRSLR